MKVYFTGQPLATRDYVELLARRPVMYSYVSRNRAAWADLSIFKGVALDSGAYSVWRRGAKVNLDDYAGYCRALSDGLDWYANLDVIGDWRATLANQRRLERLGLAPVPVFHLGEPWALLDDLVLEYDRVGIGRGPGMSFAATWRCLEEIFDRYTDDDGAPQCLFHGFRMTERRIIARFPFDSVDSTTWIAGVAYGELPTDEGRAKGFSFLSARQKAQIWLSFFDAAPKARTFKRIGRGIRHQGTPAPVRHAYAG
jgi:hypothetical protein